MLILLLFTKQTIDLFNIFILLLALLEVGNDVRDMIIAMRVNEMIFMSSELEFTLVCRNDLCFIYINLF